MPRLHQKYFSSKTKLRTAMLLFFFALSIPTLILIKQAFSQLKWETLHQHQQLAEELSLRINQELNQIIEVEEARAFAEYNYLIVEGDDQRNFLQRSPLSDFPISSSIPGLIGYFQIDTLNRFSTPLLPTTEQQHSSQFELSKKLKDQRQSLQNTIQQILNDNRLAPKRQLAELKENSGEAENAVAASNLDYSSNASYSTQAKLEPGVAQDSIESLHRQAVIADAEESAKESIAEQDELPAVAAFDRLDKNDTISSNQYLGHVADLKLDDRYQQTQKPAEKTQRLKNSSKRKVRRERSILPETALTQKSLPSPSGQEPVKINFFESEIDPLEISLLDSGHFVVYRKVWRDKQRYIQGFLLEQKPFINGIIETLHKETTLATMSDLITAYQGNVLSVSQGTLHGRFISSMDELSGDLLYQTRLSAPFSDFELIYSITQLPSSPGGSIITWVAIIIMLVLCIGTYLMYHLSLKQMSLASQQQDFVSAVSHELKTPITSIRMYGEMLKEGWADETKKNTYYHFIFDESERLTRLINNILQLARMTRNDLQAELKPVNVQRLIDNLQSKITSQIQRADFSLIIDSDEASLSSEINIDLDLFIQIIINLIDNAIKFSAKAEKKIIELNTHLLSNGFIEFSIRDYGPGIPKNQIKKIFTLFYRSENELTRETVGTGIGLALVHQLTQTMHGHVDVINREPGCEFKLSFPAIKNNETHAISMGK